MREKAAANKLTRVGMQGSVANAGQGISLIGKVPFKVMPKKQFFRRNLVGFRPLLFSERFQMEPPMSH